MSVQYVTEASQKFTCPTVTVVEPEVTAAVSVTLLPEVTEVTGLNPEVTDRVVVVGTEVANAEEMHQEETASRKRDLPALKKPTLRMKELHSLLQVSRIQAIIRGMNSEFTPDHPRRKETAAQKRRAGA
jgi:hypothetical protein